MRRIGESSFNSDGDYDELGGGYGDVYGFGNGIGVGFGVGYGPPRDTYEDQGDV